MNDHHRAKAWRKAHKICRPKLAQLIGYSVSSIVGMETGINPKGQPIDPQSFTRYRMACAALAAGLQGFQWERVVYLPLAPTKALAGPPEAQEQPASDTIQTEVAEPLPPQAQKPIVEALKYRPVWLSLGPEA
jgi:DNA-binding XRE family transcriptional regulator